MSAPHPKTEHCPPQLTPKDIGRFWSKVDKTPGLGPQGECWEWRAVRYPAGYGKFTIRSARCGAHRVAFLITHGRWPTPMGLRHCDHPPCVRPEHIFEGTCKNNMEDAAQKGRNAHGKRNGRARLTENQVAQARADRREGHTYETIAARNGVSLSAIVFACNRTTWKCLR